LLRVSAGIIGLPSSLLGCCIRPLFQFGDYLQQVVPALAGGRYLLGLMPPRLLFLPLYPGASWMLPVHFALQLLCITFDAPTNSQSGAADMRRPPVNHIEPPLGEPSGPFIDPPNASRQ
jgi:hypothetical protein